MTTQDLALMQGLIRKMDWLEERQKVLAQNIANADTPNYRPQDIAAPDFKDLLKSSASSVSLAAPTLATTKENHIGTGGSGSSGGEVAKKQKSTYEVAPAGNAVVLEEQLLKMNENVTDHRMISNLYQKNIDMLKISLKAQ